jgi:hypothetical protein
MAKPILVVWSESDFLMPMMQPWEGIPKDMSLLK